MQYRNNRKGVAVIKLYVCGSGSSGNTMILTENTKSIILDAGIKTSIVKRALNYDVSSIQFVVVTHHHL